MADTFDPYHKWLAIPPNEQPPNHYRLLGVTPFESDVDAIESAADQRMAHLRSFQNGVHTSYSQRLLNEVAQAKRILCDPSRKRQYDECLLEITRSDHTAEHFSDEGLGEFELQFMADNPPSDSLNVEFHVDTGQAVAGPGDSHIGVGHEPRHDLPLPTVLSTVQSTSQSRLEKSKESAKKNPYLIPGSVAAIGLLFLVGVLMLMLGGSENNGPRAQTGTEPRMALLGIQEAQLGHPLRFKVEVSNRSELDDELRFNLGHPRPAGATSIPTLAKSPGPPTRHSPDEPSVSWSKYDPGATWFASQSTSQSRAGPEQALLHPPQPDWRNLGQSITSAAQLSRG